jgi:hypothetical protein
VRGFGWEIAHEAVSRRPPISLDTIVARTHMYTYAAQVWDLSIVQTHLSPMQNPTLRFAILRCIYLGAARGGDTAVAVTHRRVPPVTQPSSQRHSASSDAIWRHPASSDAIASPSELLASPSELLVSPSEL